MSMQEEASESLAGMSDKVCQLCGESVRSDNQTGYCSRTLYCRQAGQRARAAALADRREANGLTRRTGAPRKRKT